MSNESHGKTLEPKLRQLHAKLSKLGVNEKLFQIIHRPGWTTPAEVHFFQQSMEHIEKTHDLLVQQLNDLHEGASLVK